MQVAMKQSLTFSWLSMQFQSHLRRQQIGRGGMEADHGVTRSRSNATVYLISSTDRLS
jgi:hypothetical protein